MIDKSAFAKISKVYASYALYRRQLFSASDELLAKAKQAIFALHRDDVVGAEKLLAEVEAGERGFSPIFKKHPDLTGEGPHRAMLEEYAEAKIFLAFCKKQPLGEIKQLALDADTVLGGLCDAVGEMARKAVHWATRRDDDGVRYALENGRDVVAALIGMNLTGYLRNKLDQAKQALRRIEDVSYDVSMHRGLHPIDLEKDAFGD
jgi:predicted translin family RNA/ssDNA-binding protein